MQPVLHNLLRVTFYDTNRIVSYRWQVKEGGYDFRYRKPIDPGSPSKVGGEVSVVVFHGKPNPHEVKDSLIEQHWR